jgi:hypothetical protein
MTVPIKIQRLLDGGQLELLPRGDADVVALWEKALRSSRDARNAANSPDNQYVLGYQALLQMGTAILAAAGYRTRGAQGHHANTFYAVAGLGIAGLEEIDVRVEGIRRMRKLSAYEPGTPSGDQLRRLHELVTEALPFAHAWLVAQRRSAGFASPDQTD